MICNCGRLDLEDFWGVIGKVYGVGSTDPKALHRGSHTQIQCFDILGRPLNRKKKN